MSHASPGPGETASKCKEALVRARFRLLARVRESGRAMDLGARGPTGATLIVRCVQAPQPKDYLALGTMVRDGDFDGAVLVHSGLGMPPQNDWPGVETCSLDELPHVLTRKSRAL